MSHLRVLTLLLLLLLALPASAQWRSLNGPPGGTVFDVAAEGDLILAGTTSGVFRSTDAGRTWRLHGLAGRAVTAVHVRNGVLYAASGWSMFVQSSAASWNEVKLDGPVDRIVSGERAVYAFNTHAYRGLFHRSLDSGRTWLRRTSLSPYLVIATAVAANGRDLYVAGSSNEAALMLRSTNEGEDWSSSALPSRATYPRSLVATDSIIVGIGLQSIVWSADRGARWNTCQSCLDGREWTPISEIAAVDGALVVVNDSGTYRSNGSPESWQRIGPSPATSVRFAATGSRLLAATPLDGILASDDHGLQWTHSSSGIGRSSVRAMLHHAGRLFVATAGGLYATPDYGGQWLYAGVPGVARALGAVDGVLLVGASDELYRTTDGGVTWATVTAALASATGPTHTVYSLHSVGRNVLAGGDFGIAASTDLGVTWTPVDTGMRWASEPVRSFASIGSRVYAASAGLGIPYGGVYISDDGGAVFRRSELSHEYPSKAVVVSGDTVVVAHASIPTWSSLSIDGASTWTKLGRRDLRTYLLEALALTPGTLYAGTDKGVYRVSMRTSAITPFNSGLDTSVPVISLAVDGAGILAGTDGTGLWQRTDLVAGLHFERDNDVASVRIRRDGNQLVIELGAGWGDASARLADVLGRVLSRAHGADPMAIDIPQLAPGSYFVVITDGVRTRAVQIPLP